MLHYMLLLLGITYVITQSVIGMPLRKLVSKAGTVPMILIYCPACTGFWVGLILGALGHWPLQPWYSATVEAGITSCALGAVWGEYGPSTNVFEIEQGDRYDDQEQEKEG
jgi:hypothetical protein